MKRILIYLFPLLVLFILNEQAALAQNKKSKKISSPANNKAVQAPIITSPVKCLNKILSVNVHIVKDSLKNVGITKDAIYKAIEEANVIFKPVCLSFKICKVDSIDNWKYNNFNVSEEVQEVKVLYNVRKTINMYFVSTIGGHTENGFAINPTASGSAADNADSNAVIVITKNPLNGVTVSHQLGHFLGLYDTFEETANGKSLVNQSNCSTTGDKICDTEADLSFQTGDYDPNCKYTGKRVDANNDFYTPPVDNIMSNHPLNCLFRFTTDQYNRITDTFLAYRIYLY